MRTNLMDTEQKRILLNDLCARIQYGVKADGYINVNKDSVDVKDVYPLISKEFVHGVWGNEVNLQGTWVDIELVCPYLRPMSSMTEDEMNKFQQCVDIIEDENYGTGYSPVAWGQMAEFIVYCNKRHLDYNGLIGMGLAMEASEGMYEI